MHGNPIKMMHEKTNQEGTLKTKIFRSLINREELSINRKNFPRNFNQSNINQASIESSREFWPKI